MKIQIKKLSQKHLKTLSKIGDEIFYYYPYLPSEHLKAFLSEKPLDKYIFFENTTFREYYVALKEDEIVGMIGLYAEKDDEDIANWLGWFFVDKSYRGNGIGTKLINFAVEKTKKMGKKRLRLYTSEHENEKVAQKFYESNGFKIFKSYPTKDERKRCVYRQSAVMKEEK